MTETTNSCGRCDDRNLCLCVAEEPCKTSKGEKKFSITPPGQGGGLLVLPERSE